MLLSPGFNFSAMLAKGEHQMLRMVGLTSVAHVLASVKTVKGPGSVLLPLRRLVVAATTACLLVSSPATAEGSGSEALSRFAGEQGTPDGIREIIPRELVLQRREPIDVATEDAKGEGIRFLFRSETGGGLDLTVSILTPAAEAPSALRDRLAASLRASENAFLGGVPCGDGQGMSFGTQNLVGSSVLAVAGPHVLKITSTSGATERGGLTFGTSGSYSFKTKSVARDACRLVASSILGTSGPRIEEDVPAPVLRAVSWALLASALLAGLVVLGSGPGRRLAMAVPGRAIGRLRLMRGPVGAGLARPARRGRPAADRGAERAKAQSAPRPRGTPDDGARAVSRDRPSSGTTTGASRRSRGLLGFASLTALSSRRRPPAATGQEMPRSDAATAVADADSRCSADALPETPTILADDIAGLPDGSSASDDAPTAPIEHPVQEATDDEAAPLLPSQPTASERVEDGSDAAREVAPDPASLAEPEQLDAGAAALSGREGAHTGETRGWRSLVAGLGLRRRVASTSEDETTQPFLDEDLADAATDDRRPSEAPDPASNIVSDGMPSNVDAASHVNETDADAASSGTTDVAVEGAEGDADEPLAASRPATFEDPEDAPGGEADENSAPALLGPSTETESETAASAVQDADSQGKADGWHPIAAAPGLSPRTAEPTAEETTEDLPEDPASESDSDHEMPASEQRAAPGGDSDGDGADRVSDPDFRGAPTPDAPVSTGEDAPDDAEVDDRVPLVPSPVADCVGTEDAQEAAADTTPKPELPDQPAEVETGAAAPALPDKRFSHETPRWRRVATMLGLRRRIAEIPTEQVEQERRKAPDAVSEPSDAILEDTARAADETVSNGVPSDEEVQTGVEEVSPGNVLAHDAWDDAGHREGTPLDPSRPADVVQLHSAIDHSRDLSSETALRAQPGDLDLGTAAPATRDGPHREKVSGWRRVAAALGLRRPAAAAPPTEIATFETMTSDHGTEGDQAVPDVAAEASSPEEYGFETLSAHASESAGAPEPGISGDANDRELRHPEDDEALLAQVAGGRFGRGAPPANPDAAEASGAPAAGKLGRAAAHARSRLRLERTIVGAMVRTTLSCLRPFRSSGRFDKKTVRVRHAPATMPGGAGVFPVYAKPTDERTAPKPADQEGRTTGPCGAATSVTVELDPIGDGPAPGMENAWQISQPSAARSRPDGQGPQVDTDEVCEEFPAESTSVLTPRAAPIDALPLYPDERRVSASSAETLGHLTEGHPEVDIAPASAGRRDPSNLTDATEPRGVVRNDDCRPAEAGSTGNAASDADCQEFDRAPETAKGFSDGSEALGAVGGFDKAPPRTTASSPPGSSPQGGAAALESAVDGRDEETDPAAAAAIQASPPPSQGKKSGVQDRSALIASSDTAISDRVEARRGEREEASLKTPQQHLPAPGEGGAMPSDAGDLPAVAETPDSVEENQTARDPAPAASIRPLPLPEPPVSGIDGALAPGAASLSGPKPAARSGRGEEVSGPAEQGDAGKPRHGRAAKRAAMPKADPRLQSTERRAAAKASETVTTWEVLATQTESVGRAAKTDGTATEDADIGSLEETPLRLDDPVSHEEPKVANLRDPASSEVSADAGQSDETPLSVTEERSDRTSAPAQSKPDAPEDADLADETILDLTDPLPSRRSGADDPDSERDPSCRAETPRVPAWSEAEVGGEAGADRAGEPAQNEHGSRRGRRTTA